MAMSEQFSALREQALAKLKATSTLTDLEQWRVAYLGKKGQLSLTLRSIGQLPKDERPQAGQAANVLKKLLEEAYASRQEVLKADDLARTISQEALDVTLPGHPATQGRLHLTTRTLREIYGIFAQMGFQVVRSREVESDLYNFQLLNIPPHHPARDMWSTFHTTREGVVLRTHTSPGQIHTMRRFCPEPIRVILPGRAYRFEQVTARAEFMFYNIEGLAIGRHITLADLKGTLVNFARRMFGPERELRFRANYFPFTEPSAEADMDCIICGGKGCRICKYTGWVEILGSGMVHPKVLANGGYDPEVFSGFAFGMGLERIAMLKHRIDDIRYFYSNDLRFLNQFS
ncbi:MAG: phenylalanine--tRNA ligase subunit alpha [Anaerolineae bacterium]|nr:phenylalanine--tRNA ligase subunit alpha [Anaerolineae bacterium]